MFTLTINQYQEVQAVIHQWLVLWHHPRGKENVTRFIVEEYILIIDWLLFTLTLLMHSILNQVYKQYIQLFSKWSLNKIRHKLFTNVLQLIRKTKQVTRFIRFTRGDLCSLKKNVAIAMLIGPIIERTNY